MNNFARYIHQFIKKKVRKINLIQNINKSIDIDQPKILISYSIDCFKTRVDHNIHHTNLAEILEICKTWYSMGFCVDIATSNETLAIEEIKFNKYDVIFGFGDVFYNAVLINPSAISILYMTEHHPIFSEKAEALRIQYYYNRHHKKIKLQRSGLYYTKKHLSEKYDHIIVLGESSLFEDIYTKVYTIFPTGLLNDKYIFAKKEHIKTRNNLLWFGSKGIIHKGLDLLIEIVKDMPDVTLHICGLPKDEVYLVKKYIENNKNIINYGMISINSDVFLDICDSCSYIILPSCSEGFSTSITTGMLHGLIPIVMRNTGFNRLNDLAFFLDDYHLDYLRNEIKQLINKSPSILNSLSRKNFDFARQNFTINSFSYNYKNIISDILKST